MKTSILFAATFVGLALPHARVYGQAPAAPPPPVATEPVPADAPVPDTSAAPPSDSTAVDVTAMEPAPAADTGGEVELSAAELAELGLGGGASDGPPVDLALKLYGFMDFSTNFVLGKKDDPWRGALGRHPAFYIGSFNLYLSKNMTESLRTFAEVRFTFLPNGSKVANSPTGEIIDGTAEDYTDFNRDLKWGGIEIERVYFEWLAHRFLTVRLGVFLTPYGIWNVDHGSPTIIPVQRPFIIGLNMFPERQTGIELLGRAAVSANNALGYHLTLSNGFGPVSEYRDYDNNKAIGGRAYWSNEGFGEFKLGGSFFYGRDTNARELTGIDASGGLVFSEKILSQSDVLSLAADIQWKYKGLVAQSEFITQQRKFTDDGRFGAVNPLVGRYIAPMDQVTLGVYGLIGYRFEWYGVMPYMLVANMNYVEPTQLTRTHTNSFNLGLNIRPIDVVAFKVEYIHSRWPEGNFVSDKPINFLMLQLAWAF